jgi:hypothetical protein
MQIIMGMVTATWNSTGFKLMFVTLKSHEVEIALALLEVENVAIDRRSRSENTEMQI